MVKVKTRYICQKCGFSSLKWLGQCTDCGAWNTMVEKAEKKGLPHLPVIGSPVRSIDAVAQDEDHRLPSTLRELDRVLGGGIVPGSLILIGGDPGIGKSTLLLQTAGGMAGAGHVLYVSGEESPGQIRLRGERLGVLYPQLQIQATTDILQIEAAVEEIKPRLLVIDSIQTMLHPQLDAVPGSVTQVKETGAFFMHMAKEKGLPVILVGHVTKSGALAGPRVLEHLVDCVLYFEGDGNTAYRILRGTKNRFGPVNEVGVFRMEKSGLMEVADPASIFLNERSGDVPGTAVLASMEGSRPLMVEVQALVSPTGFGQPQRMSTGVDQRRVAMLLAVLEKKVGMQFGYQDVYVNVTGGLRLQEPAADLGVAVAVASSFREKALPADTIFCGEVGLTGEVRGVPRIEDRLREAVKMGFKRVVVAGTTETPQECPLQLVPVKHIKEALDYLFGI